MLLEETVEETTTTITEDGDHDRFAHYCNKADILRANVLGIPAQAICGTVLEANRLPEKYPVCPTCKEIYEGLPQGGDE